MKNSKHTPGPWRIGSAGPNGSDTNVECNFGEKFQHKDGTPGEYCDLLCEVSSPADARLIASAPELLEALEKIILYNGCTGGPEALIKEFKFIAEQAIAKAKEEL